MKFVLLAAVGLVSFGFLAPARNSVKVSGSPAFSSSYLNDTTPAKRTWDTTRKNMDTTRKKRDSLSVY